MIEQILVPVAITFFTAIITWLFARKVKNQELKAMQVELSSLKVKLESSKLDNEIKSAKYYQGLLDDMSIRLDNAIEELMQSESRHRKLMDVNRELVEELQKFKQLNGKQK